MYTETFKKYKSILLLCLVALFWLIFSEARQQEMNSCLGVEILHDSDSFVQYVYRDFSDSLVFFDNAAAVDVDSSTIYISQNVEKYPSYTDFEGSLYLADSRSRLYFEYDEYFEDMPRAVREGHGFGLYITDGSGQYMRYNVVFTSLPVMRLDGVLTQPLQDGKTEPDNSDIFAGDVSLWAACDPQTMRYSAKGSAVQWHIRGKTAAEHEKKPFKLSLKNADGSNKDLEFLGMGSDDDWILNALAYDNTLMREKLFADLWNEMASETDYNYPMSEGEYIEAVINGRYAGVYYLQRRIDGKFLSLDSDHILMRYSRENPLGSSEIVHSGKTIEEVLQLTEKFFSKEDLTRLNVENYIDINIFAQFAYTADNLAHNNMFYIFEPQGDGLAVTHCYWDTDISFGKKTYNRLDLEHTINHSMTRHDTAQVTEVFPRFYLDCLSRWQYLRSNVLSEGHIMDKLAGYEAALNNSGAAERNYQRWKHARCEEDGMEELREYITRRLAWSDGYFEIKADEVRSAQ